MYLFKNWIKDENFDIPNKAQRTNNVLPNIFIAIWKYIHFCKSPTDTILCSLYIRHIPIRYFIVPFCLGYMGFKDETNMGFTVLTFTNQIKLSVAYITECSVPIL